MVEVLQLINMLHLNEFTWYLSTPADAIIFWQCSWQQQLSMERMYHQYTLVLLNIN